MSKKIKLTNLIPDQRNNNRHTAFGMDLLSKSVEQNGILESITVSNDDVIISGNARQEVIGNKFNTEPIVIETDGTRPVILKRTDIKSNTKEFYRASIMANTTAKKNIDIDTDIVEVLAEEYDLDIQEMGVDMPIDYSDKNQEVDTNFEGQHYSFKLEYTENEYIELKGKIAKIGDIPEKIFYNAVVSI